MKHGKSFFFIKFVPSLSNGQIRVEGKKLSLPIVELIFYIYIYIMNNELAYLCINLHPTYRLGGHTGTYQ